MIRDLCPVCAEGLTRIAQFEGVNICYDCHAWSKNVASYFELGEETKMTIDQQLMHVTETTAALSQSTANLAVSSTQHAELIKAHTDLLTKLQEILAVIAAVLQSLGGIFSAPPVLPTPPAPPAS